MRLRYPQHTRQDPAIVLGGSSLRYIEKVHNQLRNFMVTHIFVTEQLQIIGIIIQTKKMSDYDSTH